MSRRSRPRVRPTAAAADTPEDRMRRQEKGGRAVALFLCACIGARHTAPMHDFERIAMVGFDADDTLWRSQDYFDAAQLEFERLLAPYIDLADSRAQQRLYEVESRNIAVFGYGVKGMVLSMIEAAVELTDSRITATDLPRIVGIGKEVLRNPAHTLEKSRVGKEGSGKCRYRRCTCTIKK